MEAQAGTNANVVNEWLVEEGNIVHTIRNGVAFMNTKDTDQIMDYLEVNLAKDYKNDAGYYAEVSSSLGQNASGVSESIHTINGILGDINRAQAELADAVAGDQGRITEHRQTSAEYAAVPCLSKFGGKLCGSHRKTIRIMICGKTPSDNGWRI